MPEINCRSCGSSNIESVLSLGKIPLVNNLLSRSDEPCESHPLEVLFCNDCSLGQLRDIVPADKMFIEYLFYSSVQAPVVERAEKLARQVIEYYRPSSVLEIGSNDGYLLECYKKAGINVLGVDPARGPANSAANKGVPTVQDFFSLELAKQLPKADIIHANNVLAHCSDVNGIVAGMAQALKPHGTCIVEVPYLGDLARYCQFDTVYHEHVFYFSKQALRNLFNRHGLRIYRLEYMPDVLGGSLRAFAWKGDHQCAFADEGLDEISELQQRADNCALDLKKRIVESKNQGNTIWGFGAAAKATVVLNYAGIDSSLLTAVADDTPAKQDKFIPGTGIQVKSTQEWLETQPENTCIFVWNYAQEIMTRYWETYKGKWIPSLRTNARLEAVTVGA